jgi:hypothetical protein
LHTTNTGIPQLLTPPSFYNQWPIGLTIASDGRKFVCYTRGSDEYTLGVVVNQTAEAPFPTKGPVMNLPPNELNTTMNGIAFGSNSTTGLISVQALFVTPVCKNYPETLWILDTGRPTVHSAAGDPSMPYALPGGPKLIAMNITAGNDTVYKTYTFPSTVHYPDSFFNDMYVCWLDCIGTRLMLSKAL